jgi:hypothetical protein
VAIFRDVKLCHVAIFRDVKSDMWPFSGM